MGSATYVESSDELCLVIKMRNDPVSTALGSDMVAVVL